MKTYRIAIISLNQSAQLRYKKALSKNSNLFEISTYPFVFEPELVEEQFQEVDAIIVDIDRASQNLLEKIIRVIDQLPATIITCAENCETTVKKAIANGVDDYYLNTETHTKLIERIIVHAIEKRQFKQQIIQHAKDLQHITYHDDLCDIPNRLLFNEAAQKVVARAARYNRNMAIIIIDLDNFKLINDSLGHQFGNSALQKIVSRIKPHVRDNDIFARLDGDVFGIILDEIHQLYDAGLFIERIRKLLKQPLNIEGHEIFISASIGLASYPDSGNSAEEIVKNAEIAMFQVKELGGDNYRSHSEDMNQKLSSFFELTTALHNALNNEEFHLNYQPIMRISEKKIYACEALLRWKHNGKLISPVEFIPLAEKHGFIIPIGYWVIENVCRDISNWKNKHIATPISINISTKQLHDLNFTTHVKKIIEQFKINPELLIFEITESAIVEDIEVGLKVLHDIRDLGIRLAIDDFGTGYSSLSYLKTLPVNIVKIDKSFIDEICTNPQDQAIVKSVLTLCNTLNMDIVAEGIEELTQANELLKLGCELGQGYYYQVPANFDKISNFLLNQRALTNRA